MQLNTRLKLIAPSKKMNKQRKYKLFRTINDLGLFNLKCVFGS